MPRTMIGSAAILCCMLLPPAFAFQEQQRLVYDVTPNFSQKDGVVELRGGPWWFRTARFESDSRLTLEYLPLQEDTEASVTFGALISRNAIVAPGYRLTLPTAASARVSLVGKDVKAIDDGQVVLQPAGEWQRLEVIVAARTVRVILNGTPAGTFDVEPFAGHVLFRTRKRTMQFRNINLMTVEPEFQLIEGARAIEEIAKEGGRWPRLRREVKPVYSTGAMTEKVQGVVEIEAVVLKDGSIGPVRVTKALHPDLDKSAVTAVRHWKFDPAKLNGAAVAVVVPVEVSFTLK